MAIEIRQINMERYANLRQYSEEALAGSYYGKLVAALTDLILGVGDAAKLAEAAAFAEKDEHVWRSVATIATDRLEEAFRLTQNLDTSWAAGPFVTLTDAGRREAMENGEKVHRYRVEQGEKDSKVEPSLRSTMVGDLFVKDGKKFVVAGVGFREVE